MKSSADHVHDDDEKLISLIAQLHEEALAQLFDRYNRLVFSLALVIVRDRETAEEITLDVFMRVWQKAGTYRADQAKVSTWLTHITRNHAIDVLRRQAARPEQYSVILDEAATTSELPDHDPQIFAEAASQHERIHAALAQIPPDQKQTVLMAYFSGYTQRQIAEVLDQPLGTIKTRIRLALQKLRDLLRDEQHTGDKSIEAQSAYNISKEE